MGTDDVPVRIFWKASSTLLASKADVSMNERLLSSGVLKCQPTIIFGNVQ